MLKNLQRLLDGPSPPPCPLRRASLCSQNQQAGLKHRTLHPCKRARQHVIGNRLRLNPFCQGEKREREAGNGERGGKLSSFHPSFYLFLPSQKLSSFRQKKKRYPEIATTSEFSQPYSNRNAQLKKKKNELDPKCRCLKYVHGITIFASNYNYENGWKYIVSICMENNCRERECSVICAWHWNV